MSWGGLGVALGAATQEWNNQRKLAREDEALAMQKQQHANQQEQFGWTRDAQTEQKRVQDAEKALAAKYQPLFAGAAKGDYSGFDPLIQAYNSQQGGFGDGHYAGMQSTPQGTVVNRWDGKGNVVGSHRLDPQTAMELLQQAYMLERGGLGAAQFKEVQQMGLDARKTKATERTADATMKNADTMEKHRQNQYDLEINKPIVANDGTGRIVSISRDGKSVLGTFGAARPVLGHGGGGGGKDYSLNPQEQAQLAGILERYNATTDERERAKIAQEYQMAQSYLQLRRGKVPNLPGGLVNNPKDAKPVMTAEQYFTAFPLKKGETEQAALRRYQQFAGGGQGAGGGMAALEAAAQSTPQVGLQLGRTTGYSAGHQAVGLPQQAPLRQAPVGNEMWRLNQPGISPEAKLRIMMENGMGSGLSTRMVPR